MHNEKTWFLHNANTKEDRFSHDAAQMIVCFQPNDMGVEITSCWDWFPTPFDLDKEVMPDDENYFTAPFNRSRLEQYVKILCYDQT